MAIKTLFITAGVMGRGDDKLGEMLMANFLRLLGESSEKPAAIVFMNSGTRLVCEGSKVLEHIKKLDGQGVEILACTTCLEFFDLKEKLAVGKPTTMVKSIQAMMAEDAVVL
jgi:selenium metabolism protein YedF